MKKILRSTFIFCLILLMSVFALTGCEDILGSLGGIIGGGGNGNNNSSHNHIFGKWTITEEATCISQGLEQRVCKVCQEAETQILEKTNNHVFQSDVCTLCGYIRELDDYFIFTQLSDGTYSIAAKKYVPKQIIIPDEYRGRPVTVIGNRAFVNCNYITSVKIPDSITRIEDSAFLGCDYLTEINIPASVTYIGEFAFSACPTNLRSITVENGNAKYHSKNNCLIETDSCTLILGCEASIIPDYVTVIGSSAFRGCSNLTGISIPNGVTVIGDYAFSGCSGLTGISIPDGVTYIGLGAFSDCTGLTSINIPKGVKRIEQNTFLNCSGLTSIYIPSTVDYIHENNPFIGCSKSLEHIEVDENNPHYLSENDCLIRKGSKSLILGCKNSVIPDYVISIEDGAFKGCSDLTDITIPSSVASIGSGAFSNCVNLVTINIPNSVTKINASVFYGCSNLKSIVIPDRTTYIGDYAFYRCYNLESVTIPDSVTEIKNGAFGECISLLSLSIPANITYISNGSFMDCTNISTITIKNAEHLKYINSNIFLNCAKIVELYNLSGVSIEIGTDEYGSILRDDVKIIHTSKNEESIIDRVGDYLFMTLDNEYYLLGYVGNESELTFPENYHGNSYHVYNYAFRNNPNITKITLSEGVISIGYGAFMDCHNLLTLTLNEGLVSIGESAFYNCERLVEVYNPSSASAFFGYIKALHTSLKDDSIISQDGDFLFITYEDKNYLLGYLGNQNDIRLPNSYNGDSYEICSYAFYKNDQITKITIPTGVTAIGQGAFMECTNLESVIFEDGSTISEISYQAFSGCMSLQIINLPESVTCIGYSAFFDCVNLETLSVSDNLTDIASNAFDYCERIVNYYGNCMYLGVGSNPYFALLGILDPNVNITNYDVSSATKIIANMAFYDCSKLERINLNDGLIIIDNYAFSGCVNLDSVSIPDTVVNIGDGAFSNCYGLTDVHLSDSVTSIGDRAFLECSNIITITIPNSVSYIGESAFWGCSKLVEIYNLSNVEFITYTYEDYVVVVHTSLNTPSIIDKQGDYIFITYEGKSYLIGYEGNEVNLTLPSNYKGGMYDIYHSAFNRRKDIISVVISDAVGSIGASAFFGSSVNSVTISKSVKHINVGAFYGAWSLEEVIFAEPNGWNAKNYFNYRTFSKDELADSNVAAEYLKNSYREYTWNRE